MTIYYDNSTRTYIDSRDYTEPPATVDEALTTILNTRPYVDSLILCFGERVYCYGRNFTNLRQYREKYETQVLEKEGKTVWLPTEIMPAASASASSSTAASASAAGSDQISGKLTIWEHNASFEEALKAVIEGFNEKYPNVEVEYSIKTSDQYYNLLQTAMQAGECPDLFWTNGKATTNYESYVDQGLMMDLTDKVDFSLYDGTSAMVFLTQKETQTLTLAIYSYTCNFLRNWDKIFSAVTVALIPILIIYFLFSEQIVAGLTAGSAKE